MTTTVDVADDQKEEAVTRRPLTLVLVVVLAVTALVIAGTAGWLVATRSSSVSTPSDSSIDVGFVRDMSTHHQQAIDMAIYERAYSDNATLKLLAYDIEDTQSFEMGQMQGWLDTWGLVRSTARKPMAWMAGHTLPSDGLMPGMATADQMNHLETLRGAALDIYFLQLMIHHHQGGIPMAQYAAEHATEPYVRSLANAMVSIQTGEVVQMEQALRQLGGTPLPAPTS
jgi:uncharacterized protein (DUF305 family)